jgi:Flp pilus assembly protein TadG
MIALRIPRIAADDRGAAIIEMALVAPVLALFVIGITDMSNAYTRKLALEQGAQRAVEKIMQTTEDSTVENTLTTEAVCQVNGVNTNGTCKTTPINASNVTVTWRLECTDSSGAISTQSTTSSSTFDDMTCAPGTTKEARYVQVAVTDKYTPLFPVHFSSFTNSDGTYHISATAGMRTQ